MAWLPSSLRVTRLQLLTVVALHGQSQTAIAHLTVYELHSPNAYSGLPSHDYWLSTAIHGFTNYSLAVTGHHLLSVAINYCWRQLAKFKSSQSCVMTDSHLASLSWFEAPSGAQAQIIVAVKQLRVHWGWAHSLMRGVQVKVTLRLTVSQSVSLGVWQLWSCFLWGTLSDERMGLSFVHVAGPCQRSFTRVQVPWDSQPYFTVSDLRLLFLSPPTTRRVTVEVFDPASIWVMRGVVKVKVTLRLTVSQSVNLGVEPPSGTHDQIFIAVWQLQSCYCGSHHIASAQTA
jgi:hypothetical protein